MKLTEAVERVLGLYADEAMTPKEVHAALVTTRPLDGLKTVTATMANLAKQGRIVKIGPGQYKATGVEVRRPSSYEADRPDDWAEGGRHDAERRLACSGCWPQDGLRPDQPCRCTCHVAEGGR